MLNELTSDTYYRIELRAHNAIGYSIPTNIHLKTSRGEGESQSSDKNYVYSASFESTSKSSSLKSILEFQILTIITIFNGIFLIFY